MSSNITSANRRLGVSETGLTLFVGPSGSGSSRIAAQAFGLSDDVYRVKDRTLPEGHLMRIIRKIGEHARLGRPLAIDAPLLDPEHRNLFIRAARSNDMSTGTVLFNTDAGECVRNLREERIYEPDMPNITFEDIARQKLLLSRQRPAIETREDYDFFHVFENPSDLEHASCHMVSPDVVPPRHISGARGAYDIVGDVHGCFNELVDLTRKAGYRIGPFQDRDSDLIDVTHPEGRKLIFLGDLCDRGPENANVLRFVIGAHRSGTAAGVLGNHDDKLRRALLGRPVRTNNGLEETLEDIATRGNRFRETVLEHLSQVPLQLRLRSMGGVLDKGDGVFTAVHGAAPHHYIDQSGEGTGRRPEHVRRTAIYGIPEMNAVTRDGLPIRQDWAADHGPSPRAVVHGHTAYSHPREMNGVLCLDTGCVFGGNLTLLQADTGRVLQQKARMAYHSRNLGFPDTGKKIIDQADLRGSRTSPPSFRTEGLLRKKVADFSRS